MRTLVSQRLSLDDTLARLADLGQADIPRFSGAIALTALTAALRKKQSFKLQGDTATAYSLLESFLAFQPGKKDETDHMNVAYLRNRAGDLNVWLMLPILRQLGFSIGSHSALATGDKALHRVILRTVPPVMMESGTTSFTLAPQELPPEVEQHVWSVLKQLAFRGQATPDLQLARMRNIFAIAKAWTKDPREQEALGKV